MPITRTDRNQVFSNGKLVSEEVVETDITAEAVEFDLASKARAALAANDAFLAIGAPTNAQVLAQTRVLTRECSALIRLQGKVVNGLQDLLLDNAGT